MSIIRTAISRTLDSVAPGAANAYRWWREDAIVTGPASPTPYGFRLVGPRFLTEGSFETAEIALFLKHLESADVCIDVGANIGLYTCLASSRGKSTIAFEPMPTNQRLLLRNLV